MKWDDKASFTAFAFYCRYLQDGTVLAKYAHCFAILMRLRQLCLHPQLCAKECESLQHAQNLLQGNFMYSRVQTTPEKFEKQRYSTVLTYPSRKQTLLRHSSNSRDLKTSAFRFLLDGKHCKNGAFGKRRMTLR